MLKINELSKQFVMLMNFRVISLLALGLIWLYFLS